MEKEKNYNETNLTKKYKILFAGFLAIITLILIGTTYAFFTASTDNSHNQTASVTSGTMVLTFSDNDNGVSAVLHLGESVTKTFTIQNTGTLEAYAKITWVDLVNTYISPGLTYELSYSEAQNGTYRNVKTGTVPSANSATTTELSSTLIIPASTTYYYKLTIKYNNLTNVDQTADTSARMHSKFNIIAVKGETFKPLYYAFGNYDSSTFPRTDTSIVGGYSRRVAGGIDANNNLAICIDYNNRIECFKNNSFDYEKEHFYTVFSNNVECTNDNRSCVGSTGLYSAPKCYLYQSGKVKCIVEGEAEDQCELDSNGTLSCIARLNEPS